MDQNDGLNEILLNTKTSGEILRKLYLYRRNKNKKFSMQFICNNSQISSKGYLCDIMKGRRRLGDNYVTSLCKVFGLKGYQANYFKTLVDYEREGQAKKRRLIDKKIKYLRALLSDSEERWRRDTLSVRNLVRVFLFISRLEYPISSEGLAEKFPDLTGFEILGSLKDLEKKMLVTRTVDGRYIVTPEPFVFDKDMLESTQREFIQVALDEARKINFNNEALNSNNYFETIILPVAKGNYAKLLKKFKKFMSDTKMDLADEQFDEVALVNVQIFSKLSKE